MGSIYLFNIFTVPFGANQTKQILLIIPFKQKLMVKTHSKSYAIYAMLLCSHYLQGLMIMSYSKGLLVTTNKGAGFICMFTHHIVNTFSINYSTHSAYSILQQDPEK